jgi:hypothetical protein
MDPHELLVQAAAGFSKEPGYRKPVAAPEAMEEDDGEEGDGDGNRDEGVVTAVVFEQQCFLGDCFLVFIVMSLLPYIGRIWQCLGDICPCIRRKSADATPKHHLTPAERRNGATVSWGSMGDGRYEGRAGWEKARCQLNMTTQHAIFLSITRAVLYHLLQPIMYGWVLSTYAEQLSPLQEDLGLVVAAREFSYALVVIYGVLRRPAFLLINLEAEESASDRTFEKLMYVLAPEKFVALAVMKDGPEGFGTIYGLLLLPIDCCAIATLAIGMHLHLMPYALAIGYTATVCSFTATGGMCWSWWPAHGPNAGRHEDEDSEM